ncbi:MAG: hypothetical protein ACKVQV_06445 [Bacteroidia bacterium]
MQISIRKYIYAGILTVVIFTIGQIVYSTIKTAPCELRLVSNLGYRCLNLFKDSVKQEMKCFFELENNESAICAFNFQDKYRYVVWQLGEFRNVDLQQINFYKTKDKMILDIYPTQEFNLGVGPSLIVKDIYCFSMSEELNVLTAIEMNIDTISKDFCIASGTVNEITFANYKNENQIIVSTSNFPLFSKLVFLKQNQKFNIILVTSVENRKIPDDALKNLRLN